MFSWYKYLIVSLVFSNLGFWSGSLFLIAPFPDLCLLVLFTSLSSFFTHIETNQSVGGAKTGVPGEKPPDTPASRTWLVSHMNSCPVRGVILLLHKAWTNYVCIYNKNSKSHKIVGIQIKLVHEISSKVLKPLV